MPDRPPAEVAQCADCDRLIVRSDTVPPGYYPHASNGRCRRCASRAWRAGWVDFIDEIAVERAARGDAVQLTLREGVEVVAVLTRRGVSASEIARRVRMSPRSVTRIRARLRSAA